MLFKRRAIRRALRSLTAEADNVREISDRLARMNVYGRRGNPSWCPIARYLNKATGMEVRVDFQEVDAPPGLLWSPRPVQLPDVLQAYIKVFDVGGLPQNDARINRFQLEDTSA
jgi:hypothetical protein